MSDETVQEAPQLQHLLDMLDRKHELNLKLIRKIMALERENKAFRKRYYRDPQPDRR